MRPNILLVIERALEFSGHLVLPNLSNSVGIAKLRYIQSIGETREYRNPDTLVHGLLPAPLRWLSMLQAKNPTLKIATISILLLPHRSDETLRSSISRCDF